MSKAPRLSKEASLLLQIEEERKAFTTRLSKLLECNQVAVDITVYEGTEKLIDATVQLNWTPYVGNEYRWRSSERLLKGRTTVFCPVVAYEASHD